MNVNGQLVSAFARPYSGFTDTVTGEQRPPGETYWLWVSPSSDEQPVEIKVRGPELFSDVCQYAPGTDVVCVVDVQARNNRVINNLVSIAESAA